MGLHSGGEKISYLRNQSKESIAIATGNSFRENLLDVMTVANLKKSGYFGEASKHKGKRRVRIIESSDPVKTALEFVHKATKNYVSLIPIDGKGYRCIMRDRTEITYRWVSSSKDRSPAVELTVFNLDRVKNQKIHFVKRQK